MATPQEQADDLVNMATRALDDARAAWSSGFLGVKDTLRVGGAASQVRSAVEQMGSVLRDRWAPRRFAIAAGDQVGWDRWVKDGNDLLKNLSDTAEDANTVTLGRVLADTLTATGADIKQGAQSAADLFAGAAAFVKKYKAAFLVVGAAAALLVGWRWVRALLPG